MSKTTEKILQGAMLTDQGIAYFRSKAPYFPDYYIEVYEGDQGEQHHHFTCLVRHEHEGTWYVRHHYSTTITQDADKAMKALLWQVYVDMKFGKINPALLSRNGVPLDRIDELQCSEKERLL